MYKHMPYLGPIDMHTKAELNLVFCLSGASLEVMHNLQLVT